MVKFFMYVKKAVCTLLSLLYPFMNINGQESKFGVVDKNLITMLSLPDVLLCEDGTIVSSVKQWEKKRRPEILANFSTYMFGYVPSIKDETTWHINNVDYNALDGKAIRKEVVVWPLSSQKKYQINVQVYLPQIAKTKPVPVFFGISFHPNYTVCNDTNVVKPDIILNSDGNKLPSYKRGENTEFWQLEKILSRGYGLVTFCYKDLTNDAASDFFSSLPSSFYHAGLHAPLPNEWGAISYWAWQVSRVMDYVENDNMIDNKKVALIGHSRLAKTVLWAGALDKRFAMVVANNSGCCGASVSKHKYGESIEAINKSFPHWFCGNFKQFINREDYLFFDQHQLIALIAPRPVYVASAEKDNWSDQVGEFIGAKEASPVYHLYGLKGLECENMPHLNEAQKSGCIAYHIRTGSHTMTAYDWEQYIDFADLHLKKVH